MEKQGATFEELEDFIGREANQKLVYDGKKEEGFGWAGQMIGLIKDIPTVRELLDRWSWKHESIYIVVIKHLNELKMVFEERMEDYCDNRIKNV